MVDLSKLNPPETAPQDGRQFVAWGIDEHGCGHRKPAKHPRWCVVSCSPDYPGGEPFWRWSTPGQSTSITIIGWMELPWNDYWGDAMLGVSAASPQEPSP
ncbi:hypothetical protein [Azospirillum sp. TSA6c]|uniref:hypothetical protein n=1 Tax=Azospirillum sp. TSA6c TaxID=709813 RepID=UPI0011B6C591|nr:hypothetical protein [Azospirillum sp. TSA6c]